MFAWGKPRGAGQSSAGKDFVVWERHMAEKSRLRCEEGSRPGTDKNLVGESPSARKKLKRSWSVENGIGADKIEGRFPGESGTWQKNAGKVVWVWNSGGVDFMGRKRHGAERKPPRLFRGDFVEKTVYGGKRIVEICFGECSPGGTKFWWWGFCGEATARAEKKPPILIRGVYGEKAARGGKMGAKLFVGKPPRDGQNSGSVKAALGQKNGNGVGGEKTALGQAKCRRVFVGKAARGVKRRAKLFLGKTASKGRKFWWCGFCGEETARCRKVACKVVQGSFWRENGTWRKKNCRNLFWGKPPRDGQNSGGGDFVGRKQHGAENKLPILIGGIFGEKTARGTKMRAELFGEVFKRKRHMLLKGVESCLGESRPMRHPILMVWTLWRGNGTVQKGSLHGCSVESRPCRKNVSGVGGEKMALGEAKCSRVFVEETAPGGKEASTVVQLKAVLAEKMEAELVGRKRHWVRQNVGEFLLGKRHVALKGVQSCFGENSPKREKILVVWILWRGSGMVQKGSLGVFGEKTARGGKRIVEICFWESRPGTDKNLVVKAALGQKNGSGVGGAKTTLRQGKCGVDVVEEKQYGAEKKPPMLVEGDFGEKMARGGKNRPRLLGRKPSWAPKTFRGCGGEKTAF
ncbi:hypothetical protein T10_319 [Trichinella papuae]|uniref:Uncharacterized protein n=1 Tax=Trichinella papuae TaxID=268474 RepID=A0A0V1M4T9_9BILA|nr:hypothetical protein T10_319 [Trichinella papuae]